MNISGLEACHADLFTDYDELVEKYPAETVNKILRIRETYMTFIRTPSMTDSALVKFITTRHHVSRVTAYSDLGILKSLLPMLSKEAKEFHRWRTKEMLLETYRMSAAKMDVRSMERVTATYAKTFNVHKESEERLPLEKFPVQPWVPTDDPSVLGVTPLENRQRKVDTLLEELGAKDPDIIDITYEEADI